MKTILALTLAVALALAGCLGVDDVQPGAAATDDAPPHHPDAVPEGTLYARSLPFEGTAPAGVTGIPSSFNGVSTASYHDFYPDANVTGLVAELRWDGLMDLDLWVAPESASVYLYRNGSPGLGEGEIHRDQDGAPGLPDSVARIVLTDASLFAEPEPWAVAAAAKGGANVPYEAVVTLFYGGAPPDDFTAFEDA